MEAALKTISIGMLGAGVVGSQVARLLQSDRQELSDRSGALLVLKRSACVAILHVKVLMYP